MFRRDFLTALAAIGAMLKLSVATAQPAKIRTAPPTAADAASAEAPAIARVAPRAIVLQQSVLAGFQFHRGEQVWPALTVGAPLALIREPENCFDARAIRVEWNGQKIGYVPRAENEIAAGLMDRGERLVACIASLAVDDAPWKRVGMEIRVVV